MTATQNFNTSYSAQNSMHKFVITTDEELKKTEDFAKVSKLIFTLMQGGITNAAKGYCISMSDIIYTLLRQNNIPCRIVECQLTLTNKESDNLFVVGFEGLKEPNNPGQDTHVIVITETEHPMLIDMSISHILPSGYQGVIESVKQEKHGVMSNIITPQVSLTYQERNSNSIPFFHQRSIIDRIKTYIDIFSSIKKLKILIIAAVCVSIINGTRGFYDFYLVYFERNTWGPTAIQELNEKLNKIIEIHNKEIPDKK
jgi:hypothetical protein